MKLNEEIDKLFIQYDIANNDVSFKKYLILSDLEKEWGLVINHAGYAKIKPNENYPSSGHPSTHMFTWHTGRILEHYHFVLIVEGEGLFESDSVDMIELKSGDGFLLYPGEWHKYKPKKGVGWTELWVGFSGAIPDLVMKEPFFYRDKAVVKNCATIIVMDLFKSLLRLVDEQPFGYQRITSGICLQMIGEICNIQKNGVPASIEKTESIVSKARHIMHERIYENIDFQNFSKKNGISYSKFRADFKEQTGFAPLQYFILLKIEKAKDLLTNTNLKSKEIAFKLGFNSEYYFSRIFKKKTGLTTKTFRND